MARRGNANKYASKRRYNRAKKKMAMAKRRRYSNVQGTLIPDRTCVTLKYNEDIRIALDGAGNVMSKLFRCNSIYDPNQATAPGQQFPLGYKEYEQFYQKYVVIGSKISVTFKSLNGDDVTNSTKNHATCALTTIASPAGAITDPQELLCNNRTRYTQLMVQSPIKTLTKKFSPKRFFGINKVLDNASYGADFGNNPSQEAFWQVSVYNPAQPGTPAESVFCNIAIKYICVMRERLNIGL